MPTRSLQRSSTGVALRLGLSLALLGSLACAAPIGVRRVDERTVQRQLTSNVLTTGRPSATSEQTLQQLNLFARFSDEPEAVLADMHAGLASDPLPSDRTFALAELSFLHGTRTDQQAYLLAAAVYAWSFLLPELETNKPHPLDPRVRIAANIYNRGLTDAFKETSSGNVRFDAGTYALPFGQIQIAVDPSGFLWGGLELVDFVPMAEMQVRGLRNRYRRPGIGAPLAASVRPRQVSGRTAQLSRWIAPKAKVPVTAFLRLEHPALRESQGSLRGRLELYAADRTEIVDVEGRQVPLETELTATLGYLLASSRIWDTEILGFRRPDVIPEGSQLRMMYPYRRGRVPVVFVHGTASSTARWAEMVNDLQSDPLIRRRCQFWFFSYNTGNPIPYSAQQLRAELQAAVGELDPEGSDPALHHMAIIGHSQGGLLTRLMVSSSGDLPWRAVSSKPFDSVRLSPEGRDLLRSTLFFEPLPFVDRVIYIATPHRGSFVAANRLVGWLVSKLVTAPTRVVTTVKQFAALNPDDEVLRTLKIPRSVDAMRPGSTFVRTLAKLPTAPRVRAHSIVAVDGDGPVEKGDDGVVKYRSAHLEGVESERVVRSKHSTQGHPETIAEVRRILREQLAELPEATGELAAD